MPVLSWRGCHQSSKICFFRGKSKKNNLFTFGGQRKNDFNSPQKVIWLKKRTVHWGMKFGKALMLCRIFLLKYFSLCWFCKDKAFVPCAYINLHLHDTYILHTLTQAHVYWGIYLYMSIQCAHTFLNLVIFFTMYYIADMHNFIIWKYQIF